MLADEVDYVVGVDPHRDAHALAIVHAGTGGAVRSAQVTANARGYARALRLAEREAPGRRAWAIEGTGS
jgi:transposase